MKYKPLLYTRNPIAYYIMKNKYSIHILIFLLIFGFIMVQLFSCSIQDNKSTQFTAKNGYIDLREWDHRSTPILNINGEWKFKWMDTDSSYAEEDFDDTSWEVFNVPGVWNSPTRHGKGYAWFRAKVRVDPRINLGLYLQYSNSSYVLYINGIEAIRNGKPGESGETTIPETIPKFIRLPNTDTYIIAWKISNFHDILGGPFHPLKIGNIENIEYMFFITNFRNIFILGVTFIFIIFYVIWWSMRPQDKASIFFALFCLMIFLRTLATSQLLEQLSLPFAISTMEICTWSRKIAYGSVPLIWTFFLLFIKDISIEIPKNDFKDGFTNLIRIINKILLIIFVSSGILLFTFTLLTPIEVFTDFLVVYEILAFLAGLYSLVILIFAIINKNKYALITACGFIIFFLFIINDILFTSSMIYTGNLLPIGLVILLIFQSTVLSMRSAQAFSRVEYLSNHLSNEVNKRTLELESANSKIKKQVQEKILIFIKLAHEIKNPLTIIWNSLNKYILEHEKSEDLNRIQENFNKLKNYIINYMDSNNIEHVYPDFDEFSNVDKSDLIKNKSPFFKGFAEKEEKIKVNNQNSKKYNKPVLHIYNTKKEDILIVEEDVQLCEIIELGLFSHFNVFCYTNPIKALQDIKSIPKPEVIVVDIMMKTMNGIDFFEEIQKDSGYNDIPFIFLTAKTSETAKKEGLAAGAIVFFSKPFLVDTLRFQIESIIKNRKRLIKTSEEKAIQLIIEHLNNTQHQSKEKYSQFITKCNSFNLTPLEIEIVGKLLEGRRNAEIHESMNLGYSLVKKQLSSIYKKCGVKSRTQCVMLFTKEPLP